MSKLSSNLSSGIVAWNNWQATRGSFASKRGIAKVSKQVALAFARRTLVRCRKFEDSGASCFSEPALRDIIFASPPRFEAKHLTDASLAVTKGKNLNLVHSADIDDSSIN